MAGDCKIVNSVRTSPGFRSEMLYLKWNTAFSAINALPPEFLKKIFPDLITLKFSLLVRYGKGLQFQSRFIPTLTGVVSSGGIR